MTCSRPKCSHVIHKIAICVCALVFVCLPRRCFALSRQTTQRATGFLAPKAGWRAQHHMDDISQSVYNMTFRKASERDDNAENYHGIDGLSYPNGRGREDDLLGGDSVVFYSQKDDVRTKNEPVKGIDRAENVAKRPDGGAKNGATVTVMYSDGAGENVYGRDEEANVGVERRNRTQPYGEGGDNTSGQNGSQKKSSNIYKENLYMQLMKTFSFVDSRLKNENRYVHDSLETFIRDLKWDVWNSAATSQTAMKDFYNEQLERYKAVIDRLRRCMGEVLTRWKEITNSWTPIGRLPLIKLTKPLGMQDTRDHTELQLLIDELIDNYLTAEREHNQSVLQTIKRSVISQVITVLDSILPLKPASRVSKTWSWIKGIGERLTSWLLYPQDKGRLPFNEAGIFTYYEMPKSYIHTPATWPREYQSLPPQGGGSWRLTFLGTGARKPTKTRMTSAILFARIGEEPLWLFDCGESAITRVWAAGLTASRVRKIFLTHLHGDHCFGLFSFLYGASSATPLEVYGPSGTAQFIVDVLSSSSRSQTLRTFVVNELVIPGEEEPTDGERNSIEKVFKVNYIHPDENMQYVAYEDDGCVVRAAPLVHTINTVGYVVEEKMAETSVNTQPRKFVLCQDTFDSRWLQPLGMNADLVIHEATINAPTNCGSEMLMRLTRQEEIADVPKRVMDRLDQLVLTEEMKFQMYQSTIGNIRYYYDRKTRALREALQLQQDIENEVKELDTEVEPQDALSHGPPGVGEPADVDTDTAPSPPPQQRQQVDAETQTNSTPSWTAIVKRITTMLKLYGEVQSIARLVEDAEKLHSLIKGLRSSTLQGMKNFKSRSMQVNMRALARQILLEEGFPVIPQCEEEEEESLRVSRAIDELAPLIFQYWADVVGENVPLREDGAYGREEWEALYNEYGKLSGHSTCFQAGEFAARTRARQLILTHFSHNLPDVLERENILTMARVVHSALRGYNRSSPCKDVKNFTAGAAWDMLTVTL